MYDNGPSASNPVLYTHMLLPGSNAIDGVPPGGGVPGAGEMPFHVVITPTLDTSLDIKLTLCYDDSELNGLSESSLSLYCYSASNWLPVTPDSRDTIGNCVTKNNVSGLSAWTLGTDTPTAGALQSFSSAVCIS